MSGPIDISHTLVGLKTDQLNAEDLLTGPIVVQLEDVRTNDSDQPVTVKISGGHRPWKPNLTMRRLLTRVTKTGDASQWIGRWVELGRDPEVTWAGEAVGGIVLQAMSGLDRPQTHSLPLSKKARKSWTVLPLKPPSQRQAPDLDAILSQAGVTMGQADSWAASKGKPPISALDQDGRAKAAAFLAGPSGSAALRDMAAIETTDPSTPA